MVEIKRMKRGRRSKNNGVLVQRQAETATKEESYQHDDEKTRRGGRPWRCPRLHFLRVVASSFILIIFFMTFSWHDKITMTAKMNKDDALAPSVMQQRSSESLRMKDNDKTSSSKNNHQQNQPSQDHPHIKSNNFASIDTVVAFLTDLAKLPSAKLWNTLGMEDMDYGDDPFSLKLLESGVCPWSQDQKYNATIISSWLPPRPYRSNEIAAAFRTQQQSHYQHMEYDEGYKKKSGGMTNNNVAIWFEHISKAGGTSFCELARANMKPWQVPRWYCMPSKGKLNDGHVGRWTNDEFNLYLNESQHAFISSEFDVFKPVRLAFSERSLEVTGTPLSKQPKTMISNNINHRRPRLLFLTTIRDPVDRLLSAYTFFAITRKNSYNLTAKKTPIPFHEWLLYNTERAMKYKRGTGARYGLDGWTKSNNHITWRFSSGILHSPNLTRDTTIDDDDTQWMIPFELAIRSLVQFDLILPMEIMTKDRLGKMALEQYLGWTNFTIGGGNVKDGHVVSKGQIQNSNARSYFSKVEYHQLWEKNWLDNILYLWCRAVFLARLHCNFE
jgi:hypothetical protein